MSYTTINWIGKEKDPTKELIETLGFFILSDRTIVVRREDLIRFRLRLNKLIEKHIKTDLRIDLPILKKGDDDAEWYKARTNRNIDLEFLE